MNVPQIGVNFEISGYNTVKCTGNPETDAQNFANANNLSLQQAKAVLSGQFGTPTIDDDIELADDAEFKPTGNPQEDLINYANAKGLTKDEAKAELEELFGKPQVKKSTPAKETTNTTESNTKQSTMSDTDKATISNILSGLRTAYLGAIGAKNIWISSNYNRTAAYAYMECNRINTGSLTSMISSLNNIDLSGLDDAVVTSINSAKENAQTCVDAFNKAYAEFTNYGKYSSNDTYFQTYTTATDDLLSATVTLGTTLSNAGF